MTERLTGNAIVWRIVIDSRVYQAWMAYPSGVIWPAVLRFARSSLFLACMIQIAIGTLACGDAERPPSSLEEWRAQRHRLDATIWANERLAQSYERSLVALWDDLLQADRRGRPAEKVEALANVGVERMTIGSMAPIGVLDHGIEKFAFDAPHRDLAGADWVHLVRDLSEKGHRLIQSEWHHSRFEPPGAGAAARSLVSIVLHVGAPGNRRFVVEGDLAVEWSMEPDGEGLFVPRQVDATGLQVFARTGALAFERILSVRSPRRPDAYSGIHPLLLADLDRDDRVDVVMVRASRILWNREGEFEMGPLIEHPHLLTESGIVADFDGDGASDLLATRARGDLVLYPGGEGGHFSGKPLVTTFEEPLLGPSVLTAGDIDADGDLDAWLAQYKPAYSQGQMPNPFYDANDGYPAHLLLNEGDGRFTPATTEAGLGAKRFRRTYSGSFIDLDGDLDLDLLVVSDYAGVDLYRNDGKGHFSDASDLLHGDRHLFGMSAAISDYDLDGRLDIFVAGMGSTTARRLEALGLEREDRPEITEMRMRMAHGNRLYVARDDGFHEPDFSGDIARTGWTWGTTSFDFDNDGDPDLFAANGHQSGESTEDYCSTFWSHDLYDGASEPDASLQDLFSEESLGLRTGQESWDGYQKNHLLMNLDGDGFVDVAFLLGVADQFDSRSAVSADLDRDGRVDLLLTEHLGDEGEKLHIYRNVLDTKNSWIGVDLRKEGSGTSPIGASVIVRTTTRIHVGRVVTGESLMAQHATTLHFGLGEAEGVESIEVRWPSGASRVLRRPEPNRYHRISAPVEDGRPEVLDSSLDIEMDLLRGEALFDAILAERPGLADLPGIFEAGAPTSRSNAAER